MGVCVSKVLVLLGLSKKEMNILMVGLDFVGKTTIFSRFQLGELVGTHPAFGFNFVRFKHKKVLSTVWDIGWGDKVRRFWRQCFSNTEGVIFVVDSSDRDRVEDARRELLSLSNEDELGDAVLLVLANKQDLPTAMTVAELKDTLELHSITRRSWHIQGTCAMTGDGLQEGLAWLAANVAKKT